MRRRKILIWAAAALLAVLVAGCGKYADQTGPNRTDSSPSSSAGSAGGNQPATGGGGDGGGDAVGNAAGGAAGDGAGPGGGGGAEPAGKVQLGPLAVGESAQVGPLTVTMHRAETVDQAPAPGYTYLLIEVTVENGGSAPYTVNPTEQHKVQTPEEKNAPYNLQATALRTPKFQGTLRQGESGSGWLGFLAKKLEGTYTYTFTHPEHGEATWEFTLQ